jgi:hypothetical protein
MLDNVLRIKIIDGGFYEKQDTFTAGDPYFVLIYNNLKFKSQVYHGTKTATFNQGSL